MCINYAFHQNYLTMSKGNVSFCCFPSGLLPPPPSTAFLNTKTILSFHMQKSMLVHRLHRDVQSICVAGSPKVWLSSVLSASSSRSSPVLFLDVSLETGRLGAKRIHVNWKPHGCETGQHATPVSAIGQTRPHFHRSFHGGENRPRTEL